MISSLSEENNKSDINQEDQDILDISNFLNKSPKVSIGENLNIFFDQKMNNISLSPILPINKIHLLLKLYNLDVTKDELLKRIIKVLNGDNTNKIQTYIQNGTKIQKANTQIKIIDELFINDCFILSKASKEGAYVIADRICKTIFRESIQYKYQSSEDNKKKYAIAFLKYKDNIYIQSEPSENDNEAKLNVNKKIIIKYLPKKYSKEIINNINECLKNEEKAKNEKKARYEQFLKEAGGDRKLLKNKRKITTEEFSKRLPYYNMLEKDKKDYNDNNLLELEEEDEIFFINTENVPINEILLGDLGIVDNHLKDFKYTPFKIFEMIRDSEKKRGIDLKMEHTQVNDKNYCHNNEATIFSQKLGIKVQGFGKSKEEAENKCALNMLAIIFKNKFNTYFELHDYFEHKNGKYLDIILTEEKEEKNDDNNNKQKDNDLDLNLNESNKRKKLDENNELILKDICNIKKNENKPIYFNYNNLILDNNDDNSNSNNNTDTHESLDNQNYDITNKNINNLSNTNNYNIEIGFKNLFQCNLNNNTDINLNTTKNNSSNDLNEEINKTINNYSSLKRNKKVILD